MRRCHACYYSFSGWWCDNCDTWPCRCVGPDEPCQEVTGEAGSPQEAVHEAPVPDAASGAEGAAPDAADAAGAASVPVREAPATDVAPDEEPAAPLSGQWDRGPVSYEREGVSYIGMRVVEPMPITLEIVRPEEPR